MVPFLDIANETVETSTCGTDRRRLVSDQPFHPSTSEGRVIEIIFSVWVSGVISVLGSTANVINIIVFVKQGFNDSVNISLCALAISDMGAILPALWRSISLNHLFQSANIDFGSPQLQYKTTGWAHRYFVIITSWITAFITFERCVCIALPIKVKNIITTRRTFISMVVVFVVISASVIPAFIAINVTSSLSFDHNTTQNDLSYITFLSRVEVICFNVNTSEQLSSFFIVIICTIILINNLIFISKWRQKANATSTQKSDSISTRDKRVVKMVTFISSIFIACYLPGTANAIMSIFLSSEYRINGLYQIAYQISWSCILALEVFNSSINIFVYYNMSSKFRVTFNDIFRKGHDGKK